MGSGMRLHGCFHLSRPSPRAAVPRVRDRKCLVGSVFVLLTGCGWNDLPAELGCGDGSTCWRRLRQWTEAGVWPALRQRVLSALGKQAWGLTRGQTPRIGAREA